MRDQIELVTRALLKLIRQHQRLRRGFPRPVLTITIDDLALLVRARTGLAVERDAIRNLVDALVTAGILDRHADRRYTASTYWFTTTGAELDSYVDRFLVSYSPRWEPFPTQLDALSAHLAHYETLWQLSHGGLPKSPSLPVLTWVARLTGNRGLLLLKSMCAKLQRPPHYSTSSQLH